MTIITILILPMQQHGIFFHFFESLLISFISVHSSQYISLLSLWSGLFLSILFCFSKGIFFLTFPFWYFIVNVKKCNQFLYVILRSCYLAKSVNSSSFCVEFLEFSTYIILLSTYNDKFTSSLPMWIPIISFPCLITVVRTVDTMLNKNGKREHPCLVLDYSRKVLSFSPLSTMLAVGLL